MAASSDYYDSLETRDSEQRERALMASLAEHIEHAQRHCATYARTLAGVDARSVSSREALAQLPVTRKSALMDLQRASMPFGGLNAVPIGNLARVFASPGPIFDPEARAPDYWRFARAMFAAGFRAGELIQNCFSYHFTPAASMAEGGAQALGCAVIPAGVGQTETQVQTIAMLRPQAYVGTPSFLKIILDKAKELGLDCSSVTRALVSAEPYPPSLRAEFRARGVRALQCYASADLGLIAYESQAEEGMIVDEGVLLELVRPGTGDPVPAGEVGEVVVTTFNRAYPLIRFATGDLSAVLPGLSPCGRTNVRIKGWMGRADQTTKVRGMFVHPEQIAEVVRRHAVVMRARLIVEHAEGVDAMTLKCEVPTAVPGLIEAIAQSVQSVCKLRGAVELVGPGELPNDGKVIDDLRHHE